MHVVERITSQLSLVSYKGIYTGRAYISDYVPVTGFPNWKYVAILASFLVPCSPII